MNDPGFARKQGLYDPGREHDACGVGFIANIQGIRSHQVIADGLQILKNLEHRGACGCDPDTGDGAGVMIQLPDAFMRREAGRIGIELPPPGRYAVGMVFLALDEAHAARQIQRLEEVVVAEGQRVLGWRDVPHDPAAVGRVAREGLPGIRQIFVEATGHEAEDVDAFERKLYVIRRQVEKAVWEHSQGEDHFFYVPTLSCRTIAYVGMLISRQIEAFYPDLVDPEMVSALALVHSRYSTNTMPTWSLAHPFRFLAHNGEINTLRGNQELDAGPRRDHEVRVSFGDDLEKIFPDHPGGRQRLGLSSTTRWSSSILSGREPAPGGHLMMIPEAWETSAESMDPDRQARIYEYHSFLLEPWDGPASIAFTDGRARSAPCSTATDCGRPVTSSPRTASS